MNIAFSPLSATRRVSAPKFGNADSREQALQLFKQVAEDVKSAKITLTQNDYDPNRYPDYDDCNGGRMSLYVAHPEYTRSFDVKSKALGDYTVKVFLQEGHLLESTIVFPASGILSLKDRIFTGLHYQPRKFTQTNYDTFMPVMQAINDTLHQQTKPEDHRGGPPTTDERAAIAQANRKMSTFPRNWCLFDQLVDLSAPKR